MPKGSFETFESLLFEAMPPDLREKIRHASDEELRALVGELFVLAEGRLPGDADCR